MLHKTFEVNYTFDYAKNLDKLRQEWAKPSRWYCRPKNFSLPAYFTLFLNDSLLDIYKEKKILRNSGEIHYAAIVQADINLFAYNELHTPAAVLYATDSYYDENPAALLELANKLYDYKFETTPDGMEEIVKAVTEDNLRYYNLPLPSFLTPAGTVLYTNVMVFRNHISRGYLTTGIYPVLCSKQAKCIFILPYKYWPKEFRKITAGK